MRIATLYNKDLKRFGDLAAINHKIYAQEQGYDWTLHYGIIAPERPAAWSKIPFIKNQLAGMPKNATLLWIDADAYFINKSQRLDNIPVPDKDMTLCIDSSGNLNTGVWFIKNTEWSHNFLDEVWAQEQFIYHMWWENTAVMFLYDRYKDHFGIRPYKMMNVYPQDYEPGDFILHFAGRNKDARLQSMLLNRQEVREAFIQY